MREFLTLQSTGRGSANGSAIVLAQGEAAYGMVFFPAREEHVFRAVTLRLRFVATEAGPDVMVRVPVSG